MTTRAAFTKHLHYYLVERGYTHMYSIGVRTKPGEAEENEDYILVPLKPGDPRLSYEETDSIINGINDHDVMDMTEGDEFIRFYVEIPMEEYDQYYLKNK